MFKRRSPPLKKPVKKLRKQKFDGEPQIQFELVLEELLVRFKRHFFAQGDLVALIETQDPSLISRFPSFNGQPSGVMQFVWWRSWASMWAFNRFTNIALSVGVRPRGAQQLWLKELQYNAVLERIFNAEQDLLALLLCQKK